MSKKIATQLHVAMDKSFIVESLPPTKVTLLCALEMGSRVWGWGHAKSDYDLRFLYVRPLRQYVSLRQPDDSITYRTEWQGCEVDAHGWDIRKFVALLLKSNPSAIEWMHSPTFYFKEWPTDCFAEAADVIYSPLALYNHYYGQAFSQHKRYVETPEASINVTKYFHVLRALLMIVWLRDHFVYPPSLRIQDLLEGCHVSMTVKQETLALIQARQDGDKFSTARSPIMEHALHKMLAELRDPPEIFTFRRNTPDKDLADSLEELMLAVLGL